MGFFSLGASYILFHRLMLNKMTNKRLTHKAYKWPMNMLAAGLIATTIEFVRQRNLPYQLQKVEINDDLRRLYKLDNLEGQQFKDKENELKEKIAQYRVD